MKHLLKYSTRTFLSILFIYSSYGQQKNDYSVKIDSLIETTSPRAFNGVVLITQQGKIKYSKTRGYSNFDKKLH